MACEELIVHSIQKKLFPFFHSPAQRDVIPRTSWVSVHSFLDVHPEVTILAQTKPEKFKSGTWEFGKYLASQLRLRR